MATITLTRTVTEQVDTDTWTEEQRKNLVKYYIGPADIERAMRQHQGDLFLFDKLFALALRRAMEPLEL